MKAKTVALAIAGLAVLGLGAWLVFRRRDELQAPLGPDVVTRPLPPGVEGSVSGSGGPSAGRVVGAVAGTVATVLPHVLAGTAAAAAVGAAALPGTTLAVGTGLTGISTGAGVSVASAGAGGAAVGGSTTIGSVASEQAATVGGSVGAGGSGGSGLGAFLTNPITIFAGLAIAAFFVWKAHRNETKDDREDFARGILGWDYIDHGSYTNAFDMLIDRLRAIDPDQADQLRAIALGEVGKHDFAANDRWMQAVIWLWNRPAIDAGTVQVIVESDGTSYLRFGPRDTDGDGNLQRFLDSYVPVTDEPIGLSI